MPTTQLSAQRVAPVLNNRDKIYGSHRGDPAGSAGITWHLSEMQILRLVPLGKRPSICFDAPMTLVPAKGRSHRASWESPNH